MQEQIRFEIRKVLRENEASDKEELIRLRTFHYNVHHIVFNPIVNPSSDQIVKEIITLLQDFKW